MPGEVGNLSRLHCRVGELAYEQSLTLTQLADAVGIDVVNLSVFKNDRAKAIRFSTLIDCDASAASLAICSPCGRWNPEPAGCCAAHPCPLFACRTVCTWRIGVDDYPGYDLLKGRDVVHTR